MSSYEELANLWQGIATGGCEEHATANPEDYPAECIICLRAALTQAQASLCALMDAAEPFTRPDDNILRPKQDWELLARVYEQVKRGSESLPPKEKA